MKQLGKLITLSCALATVAAGQDIQARGRQIIDEAIAALGGEKFLNMQNRIETGRAYSFFQNQLSGLSVARFYTRYVPIDAAKSGVELAQQEYQAFGKDEAFYNVFREEGGWEVTYRGPVKIEKELVERHHDSTMHNLFYILRTRLKEPGLIFEYKGSDVIENTPMNIVDIIDSENRVTTAYFHPGTKLPLRQSYVWRDSDRERNEEVTRFSRYRTVDGVQWPYQVNRERNGRKTYEMFADTVQINEDIDEKRFAVPDANSRPIKTSTDPPKKR